MVKSYDFGTPTKYYDLRLKDFLGVDFSSYPSEVSSKRTPEAVNIFSSRNGIIEKRTGFKKESEITHSQYVPSGENSDIQGFWQFKLEQDTIVDVGTNEYQNTTVGNLIQFCQLGRFLYYRVREFPDDVIYWSDWDHVKYIQGNNLINFVQTEKGINDIKLTLTPISNKITKKSVNGGNIDLKTYRVFFYGGSTDGVIKFERELVQAPVVLSAVDTFEEAYVPTTRITTNSTANDSESFEDISSLTPIRKHGYLKAETIMRLPLDITLDNATVAKHHGEPVMIDSYIGYVKLDYLDTYGEWHTLNEGMGDLLVDRQERKVTVVDTSQFFPATITGEDCAYLTFSVGVDSYLKYTSTTTSNKKYVTWFADTKASGLMGLNNRANYLFCAKQNMDRYINIDTFYSSDLAYTLVGSDQADILGYSIVERNMIIHKERYRNEGTMYVRSATLDEFSEVIFPVTTGASNIDAISKDTFTMFRDEPMFLTKDGVYAVITNNVTNVQALQNRSFYIDKILTREPNLNRSKALSHDGYWYLFLDNGHVYVADSRRKSYAEDSKTESFQYDWYYWEDIYAENVFIIDDKVHFTKDNKIFVFKDQTDENAYSDVDENDNLVPVKAYWTTPILYMGDITFKKSLKNLWARLATYDRSGVEIYYRLKGEEKMVKQTDIDLFDFNDIDFTRFTFNTDTSPHVVVTNRMERQFMSIQFMFKNENAEPFGLLEIVARYKINSEYKGG